MTEMNIKELIRLETAGLKIAGNWLVRGVTFSVAKGEIVTLIGPNGSGKSTSAKMALGIMNPTEGEAWQSANLRIGYVPQKLSIDWTMPLTVKRLLTLTRNLSVNQIELALERTGVKHLKNEQVQNLSGGEFQRVLLARALALKPDLLVLDEPAQGVDFNGEAALYRLISELRDELECGVLLISHDLHMVMAATDRVICLNGHMCCHGTPMSVVQNPVYKDLFGERAAATFAVYQHQHDHVHLPDGTVEHADGSITEHCHPDDGHHHDQKGETHAG